MKWTKEQSDKLRPYFQLAIFLCGLVILLNVAMLAIHIARILM